MGDLGRLKDVRSKDRFYELKPVAMAYSRFRCSLGKGGEG